MTSPPTEETLTVHLAYHPHMCLVLHYRKIGGCNYYNAALYPTSNTLATPIVHVGTDFQYPPYLPSGTTTDHTLLFLNSTVEFCIHAKDVPTLRAWLEKCRAYAYQREQADTTACAT